MPQNLEVNAITRAIAEFKEIQRTIPKNSENQDRENTFKSPLLSTAPFIDPTRLSELRVIRSPDFDLSKLIRYCDELNFNYDKGYCLAVAMLGRAILDHVPPIFECKSFSEVANNYSSGSKSFKQSMEHLENSLRKIADAYLHVQIRKSEVLPNRTQVNFSCDLDVLLAEIVRLLKQ
jgi:hypothetical protein